MLSSAIFLTFKVLTTSPPFWVAGVRVGLGWQTPCGCSCQLRGQGNGFPVLPPSTEDSNSCREPKGRDIYGLITGLLILIYMPPVGLTRGSKGGRDVGKYVSGLPITQPASPASEQEVSWVNRLYALC